MSPFSQQRERRGESRSAFVFVAMIINIVNEMRHCLCVAKISPSVSLSPGKAEKE